MIFALLTTAIATTAALAVSIIVSVRWRRGGLSHRLRRTLVVHTKDGKSFRGVLTAEHADCLVLCQTELLDDKVPIGGEAVLLLANISWAQDVTGVPRPGAGAEDPAKFELERGERP